MSLLYKDVEVGQEFLVNVTTLTAVFRGLDVMVLRTNDGSEFAVTESQFNSMVKARTIALL